MKSIVRAYFCRRALALTSLALITIAHFETRFIRCRVPAFVQAGPAAG
jgi:hypothetical protein